MRTHSPVARRATFAVLPIAIAIAAFGGDPGAATRLATRYGPPGAVGAGTARTYVIIEGDAPVEVGIELDSMALERLPAARNQPMGPGHEDMHVYLLSMPADNPTPYRFAELDWNPAGHHPQFIYGVPHFDFHFYLIDRAAREAIDSSDAAWDRRMNNLPTPEFVPAGYEYAGKSFGGPIIYATVPHMGVHWVSTASPELQRSPERFTHTYLVGTWDGRVIFHEPMVTLETLLRRRTIETPVPVARAHERDGYYPDAYRIAWLASQGRYRVSLTRLAWRE